MYENAQSQQKQKQRILSGCTVTGDLTLGNYIGAIRQWQKMQEDFDCFFMLANLHAITVPQNPEELKKRTRSFFAQYLALGLNPDKSTIFIQSQVQAHAQLQWVLTCISPLGNLQRMTQFKDKSQRYEKNITAGLLMYPALMAADILLYDAHLVPVGEDQTQHLEYTRDLVIYFHNAYGETFVMPKAYNPPLGAKIMSLQDPLKKMSKSDENPKSFISILDPLKTMEKKIKAAVTDSGDKILYDKEKNPGISNLITLFSILSHWDIPQVEKHFEGKLYGHLKAELAELVCQTFAPIQAKYNDYMKNTDYLESIIQQGAEKANQQAQSVLKRVYERTGLF